jgi:hypothetical protein
MADANKQFMVQVRGQDPLTAIAPTYSNFVAVARLGTEVQFEFIFLDLNQLALFTEKAKKGEAVDPEFQGKTVAKIVVPGPSIVHMREHFEHIFRALEEALQSQEANTSVAGGQS